MVDDSQWESLRVKDMLGRDFLQPSSIEGSECIKSTCFLLLKFTLTTSSSCLTRQLDWIQECVVDLSRPAWTCSCRVAHISAQHVHSVCDASLDSKPKLTHRPARWWDDRKLLTEMCLNVLNVQTWEAWGLLIETNEQRVNFGFISSRNFDLIVACFEAQQQMTFTWSISFLLVMCMLQVAVTVSSKSATVLITWAYRIVMLDCHHHLNHKHHQWLLTDQVLIHRGRV